MGKTVAYDTATPALRALLKGLRAPAAILKVAGDVRATIISRTLGGTSLTGGKFSGYASDGTYYAPIKKRPPGYPSPKGGRSEALRGGWKLKTRAYDEGYGDYKSKQGFGGSPQLSLSGGMLGNILIRVISERKAELFFGSRLHAAKAHGLHTGKFPFFGLMVSEQNNLPKALLGYLRDQGAI